MVDGIGSAWVDASRQHPHWYDASILIIYCNTRVTGGTWSASVLVPVMPTTRPMVQRYLRISPEEARRVVAWTGQRDALRVVFAARAAAPLPHGLDLSRLIKQRLRRRRVPWLAAASVVLALAVGGGTGWLLRPVHRTVRRRQRRDVPHRRAAGTPWSS
jgi:anti-sigma factor RsiW